MLTAVCVDDSQVELDLIKRILEELGVKVLHCDRYGDSGMRAIRAHRPSIAVLDIVLPGMTGLDILVTVQAENLPTVCVMCTSMSMLRKQAMAAGAAQFITKPYDDFITGAELIPILEPLGYVRM